MEVYTAHNMLMEIAAAAGIERGEAFTAEEVVRRLSREDDLRKGIADIKDELNGLAMVGAVPLWGSLIGRLDDLYEQLFTDNAR